MTNTRNIIVGNTGYFVYNGLDSRDFCLIADTSERFNGPEKNVKSYNLPGRSGTFYAAESTYKNYTINVPVCFAEQDAPADMELLANRLKKWLLTDGASDVYHNLQFGGSNDYRKARYIGNVSLDIMGLLDHGTATLRFDCYPYMYSPQSGGYQIIAAYATKISSIIPWPSESFYTENMVGKIKFLRMDNTEPSQTIYISDTASGAETGHIGVLFNHVPSTGYPEVTIDLETLKATWANGDDASDACVFVGDFDFKQNRYIRRRSDKTAVTVNPVFMHL